MKRVFHQSFFLNVEPNKGMFIFSVQFNFISLLPTKYDREILELVFQAFSRVHLFANIRYLTIGTSCSKISREERLILANSKVWREELYLRWITWFLFKFGDLSIIWRHISSSILVAKGFLHTDKEAEFSFQAESFFSSYGTCLS